ncbi:MDR family oxidoreductase [Oceanospirillum linum]|uniref:Oxidoreductase n=1 Tax=Oceanospirillum linum TaxID=966 RepID=A0A1T1HBC3_OCELI|nr:MDR family oxidoreductase [Oceanospirillum linum]OOV87113.1 oxidoreductase [Oceanospirillum linum]SEF74850.1 putative quinone oxidoreductase, YhdH/YhfP family [Oleiphilus messinensis]SMP16996.1 acrylyl-CoA reductase (NADPH) [Oceanospirillum linum]
MNKALVLEQEDKKTLAGVRNLDTAELPEGDILVNIDYSSMNYKDALAVTGTGKIVHQFPMVPGIDLAGTVAESDNPNYKAGDTVVLTGWSVGEKYWGGYAQQMRLQSKWLVPLAEGLTAKQAMTIGTAGLTSMLCVMRLQESGLKPEDGPVLVTGATGGVGSLAVALLAKNGFDVVAVSGKTDSTDYLKKLGASDVLPRSEFEDKARPLDKSRWAGAVDTVGGDILAKVLSQMNYDGRVATVGLASSFALNTTVMPFILRGVDLLGVDSVMIPYERRVQAWTRLAKELPQEIIDQVSEEISLEQLPEQAQKMVEGKVKGRVLVNPNL